jgi:hypothetical protein
MNIRIAVFRIAVLLTFLLVGGLSVSAQQAPPFTAEVVCPAAPELVASGDTPEAFSYFLDQFGPLYVILCARNLGVFVSGVEGGVDTGSVTLLLNGSPYKASYAGPLPGFPDFGLQQVNVPIPKGVMPHGGLASIFLRICDAENHCRNSNGAVLRRE